MQEQSESANCLLPARFAGLASTVSVIFIRESAALFPATAAIAVPVTASVTIESPASPATRTATGCGFRPRFVHLQIPSADFFSIQAGNGLRRLRIVGHFDKCEPTSAARFPIHGDVNSGDLSKRLEQRTQIGLGRLETHVSNK